MTVNFEDDCQEEAAGTRLAGPLALGLNQKGWHMVTRDQAIHCINRVRRIEELMTRAERTQELPPDYPLLVLMLQQLRRRESLLMAELTPEEQQEVREQIRQQNGSH